MQLRHIMDDRCLSSSQVNITVKYISKGALVTLSFFEMGSEALRTNPNFRKALARLIDREIQDYLKKG